MNKITAILSGLLLLAGCSTTSTTSEFDRARRVENGVRLAVFIGTSMDLSKNPERRTAYQAASSGLSSLVAQETWDVSALALALAETGNEKFRDNETILLVLAGAQLVDVVVGSDRVDLGNQVYARAVVIGADSGLKLALK